MTHFILCKKIIDFIQSESISPLNSEFDSSNKVEGKELFSWGGDGLNSSEDLLYISFNSIKTLEIISQLDSRIASFKELIMSFVPDKNSYVKRFLSDCFPEEGDEFSFNLQNRKMINFGYYRNALLKAISSINEHVLIGYCKLSQEDIIRVMEKSKSLYTFEFCKGELDLDSVPQFGSSLEGSKIKTLILEKFDFSKNYKKLQNFVEGMAQSKGFLDNLQEIKLLDCNISKKQANRILKKHTDTDNLNIICKDKDTE